MNESQSLPPGEPVPITILRPPPLPRRILVADDDDEIRRLNAEVLISYGYHVDAAADGGVAWEALKGGTYDLLITDHTMPKVSGVELLQKLHSAQMAVPVILITGFYPTHEFSRRPWLQTAATLLKPYTISDLLAAVATALRAVDNVTERRALPPDQHAGPLPDRLRS